MPTLRTVKEQTVVCYAQPKLWRSVLGKLKTVNENGTDLDNSLCMAFFTRSVIVLSNMYQYVLVASVA
jgi:hypothetical protein